MKVLTLKSGLMNVTTGAVITAGMVGLFNNSVFASSFHVDAVKTEYLQQKITVNGGDKIVDMMLRSIDLSDLLKLLATKAGFNLVLDESVTGTISVDLNNVSVNQALETIKDYADLVYMQDNKTLIVSNKESQLANTINQQVSKMIPVKYINAKLITGLLNSTIFSVEDGLEKATPEYRTNSVVVVGTDNDIRLAEDFVSTIDKPRKYKTFSINHADVIDITQLIQATVFNDGVNVYDSIPAQSQGMTLQSSPLSITSESFQEGAGAASQVQGSSASSSGGQSQVYSLRTKVLQQKDIKIAPDGPLLIPDTRSNTLTVMGTTEQIALVEAILPTLDEKLPQVAIETSLIEVSDGAMREFEVIWGNTAGQWATGFNDSRAGIAPRNPGIRPSSSVTETTDPESGSAVETFITNVIGLPTIVNNGLNAKGNVLAFSTTPLNTGLDFIYQINAMLAKDKAKLLANPTVVALHNTEAIISITEEIIRRTTVTIDSTGFAQTQTEIGEAGIVLNILPKVTGDGFVVLRIRPSVSTVADVVVKDDGNTTTLLRKKDFSVQEARVLDGQTLALGGLIEERSRNDASKIPWLGDVPIIGALFRASSRIQERTELIMLVTPNIISDDKPLKVSSYKVKPEVIIPYTKHVNSKELSGCKEEQQIDITQPITRPISLEPTKFIDKSKSDKELVNELLRKYQIKNSN